MQARLVTLSILDAGCFGVLLLDDVPVCMTLERTYGMDVKIKAGLYQLIRSRYIKGGYDTWQVVGGDITPERRILIHRGNKEGDSEGCILVGAMATPTIQLLSESRLAHTRLMMLTEGFKTIPLKVEGRP